MNNQTRQVNTNIPYEQLDQTGEHEHTIYNNYTRQVNTNMPYKQLIRPGR